MQFLKKYYPYITAIAVFIIYMLTLAPTVMQIDSGELSTVQYTLSIAHPTGYPLFTILGHLFLLLPLPVTKIYLANLFAALCCSLALIFFIKVINLLVDFTLATRPVPVTSKKLKKNKNAIPVPEFIKLLRTDWEKIFIAVCSALMLAFNLTFWNLSNSIEVYSLQSLLICIILLLAVRFFIKDKLELKDYFFLSAAVAFGFTNHMTTLLLIPGLIYLFFAKVGFSKEIFKKIIYMLILFFGILALVYSYIFIRAAQNPVQNWDNPINWHNFIVHLSGRQYQVWLFSSLDAAMGHLGDYLIGLPGQFGYLTWIFILTGIYNIYKLSKKLFIFFIITYLFSVLYTINYDIHDLDSYFVTSYTILTIFAAFGIVKTIPWIKNKLQNKIKFAGTVSFSFPVLAIFLMFGVNYSQADESKIYLFEDYTKSVLGSLPQNSVVMSSLWDYFVSESMYFQHVEGFRKDVAVIDKELCKRSWYYHQLETNRPDIVKNIKPQINSFLVSLAPFEQGKDYNGNEIENNYQAVLNGFISANIGDKDIFLGEELLDNDIAKGELKLDKKYTLVPYGITLKVVSDFSKYVENAPLNFKLRFPKERDSYAQFLYDQVGNVLGRRIIYEVQFNRKDKALEVANKIKTDLPDYQIPDDIAKLLK